MRKQRSLNRLATAAIMSGAIMLAAPAAAIQEIKTDVGVLSVKGAALSIDGIALVTKESQDASFAELNAVYEYADRTDILVQFIYGTACPAQYQWLSVQKRTLIFSSIFGSCSDLEESWGTQGVSMVRLPGHGTNTGAFHYAFDGAELKTSTFDSRGYHTGDEVRPTIRAVDLGRAEVPTPSSRTVKVPSKSHQGVFPTVKGDGIMVEFVKAFDVGPIIMGAAMKGCASPYPERHQIRTATFGSFAMDEYVFDSGCLPIKSGAELGGVGILSNGGSIALSFMYVKGARARLIKYLQVQ